jgi:hypothetical protein
LLSDFCGFVGFVGVGYCAVARMGGKCEEKDCKGNVFEGHGGNVEFSKLSANENLFG